MRRNAKTNQAGGPSSTGTRSLVHIEPFRLWTIKILYKFSIINKEESHNLLEQYLDTLNKVKANISAESEQQSDEYLTSLEPTQWKEHDHYLILGLQHLRYKATEDDIKRAHRRKARKHHPDKKTKEEVGSLPNYFECITKAFDLLSNPVKRRSFDSVDPTFDDTVPIQIKSAKLEQDPSLFYRIFAPAFEQNARWSVSKNVPILGDERSSRQQVERFYQFWYEFQSWREFSYLDEEDKEKGENRDERRWLDRQNKSARQQRKKAENQRIRQLVDNAYSCDPRIARFKEEDKQKRLDVKRAKQEEVRQRIEREQAQQAQRLEEEKQKKTALEEEEKKKRLDEKKQRDQLKKETKKTIKSLEEIFKANEYFVTNQRDKIKHIEELDRLTKMLSLSEIKQFKGQMDKAEEFAAKRDLFLTQINNMNAKIEEEKKQSLIKPSSPVTNGNDLKPKIAPWTEDEIKLLVKAVSLHPAGTKDRWEVVSQYMAQHSPVQRDAKQILAKVKLIQEQLAKRRG